MLTSRRKNLKNGPEARRHTTRRLGYTWRLALPRRIWRGRSPKRGSVTELALTGLAPSLGTKPQRVAASPSPAASPLSSPRFSTPTEGEQRRRPSKSRRRPPPRASPRWPPSPPLFSSLFVGWDVKWKQTLGQFIYVSMLQNSIRSQIFNVF